MLAIVCMKGVGLISMLVSLEAMAAHVPTRHSSSSFGELEDCGGIHLRPRVSHSRKHSFIQHSNAIRKSKISKISHTSSNTALSLDMPRHLGPEMQGKGYFDAGIDYTVDEIVNGTDLNGTHHPHHHVFVHIHDTWHWQVLFMGLSGFVFVVAVLMLCRYWSTTEVFSERRSCVPGSISGYPRREPIADAMTYHTADLSEWRSVASVSMTVWSRRSLWLMAVRLLALSFAVAAIVLFVLPDAGELHVDQLQEISRFMNAFVGLLLGFFMASSVNRWWACAEGFLILFDAIRAMQMQLCALGVPEPKVRNCVRYGVVSAWILSIQLHTEALREDMRSAAHEDMWKTLSSGEGLDEYFASLVPGELEVLRDIHDPAGLLWMWVGSFVARLAQDGEIPAMPTPTYGRIMNIAADAHGGIRRVRSSISVQAPYIYVQLLASLVHLNNVVNALAFGMTFGATLGMSYRLYSNPDTVSIATASWDAQSVMVSFFFSCFGPFIYQAMLEVSIVLAEPFSSIDGEIPTVRLLKGLENDLHDGRKMAESTPWEPPRFKADREHA